MRATPLDSPRPAAPMFGKARPLFLLRVWFDLANCVNYLIRGAVMACFLGSERPAWGSGIEPRDLTHTDPGLTVRTESCARFAAVVAARCRNGHHKQTSRLRPRKYLRQTSRQCDHRLGNELFVFGTNVSSLLYRSTMSDHSPIGGRAPNSAQNRRVFFSFSCDEDRHKLGVIYDSCKRLIHRALRVSWTAGSERVKTRGQEEVKRAIREGIDQTTVTCVLVGGHTWQDRWVRYEIARSVARGSGLFAVRINRMANSKTQQRTSAGWNPLSYVGVGKTKGGDYLLFENINGQWFRYQDHAISLAKPTYLPAMSQGYVQPLSVGLNEYDYVAQNGAEKLAEWIEEAAEKAEGEYMKLG